MTEQNRTTDIQSERERPSELDQLIESTAQQYRNHSAKREDGGPYILPDAAGDAIAAMANAGRNIPELTGFVVRQTQISPAEAFENHTAHIKLEKSDWYGFFAKVLSEIVWHETVLAFPDLNEEDTRRIDADEA